MQTSIIRPGLLVSLKTTLHGGVSYQKETIESASVNEEGAEIETWQTTRVVTDHEEHERAISARGKARAAVTRVCCSSTFGLLCPQAKESELAVAIAAAQEIANEFNRQANHSRLDVYVITGRVADSDQQAARAIGAEVRELIEAMERGVRAADPAAIREAASKARAVAGMLSDETQTKVAAAIEEVRKVAREIVRRVEVESVSAASVVEGVKLDALQSARFAVLDIAETAGASEVAPPAQAAPEVDLDPTPAAFRSAGPTPAVFEFN